MKQVIETIYNFNELVETVQEKLINLEIECISVVWEPFLEELEKELESEGFKSPEIHYDIGYSQGSGACFDAEIDLKNFVSVYKDKLPLLSKRLDRLDDYIEGGICKNSYSNHYSHRKTRYTEIEIIHRDPRVSKVLLKEADKLDSLIERDRLAACDRIYQELQDQLEHDTNRERIKEMLLEDNVTFYHQDGEIYVNPC